MPPEEAQDRPHTFWWVENGVMHSAWKLGSINFQAEAFDTDMNTVLRWMLTDEHSQCASISRKLAAMADRPGVWYLMAGMDMVHSLDLYTTREAAAQAEFDRLMEQ